MVRRVVRMVLFAFLLLVPQLAVAAQENGVQVGGVTVLGPDEDYAGVSRAEWEAHSWQWATSFSMEASPSFDTTGERCGFGQHGLMFFLPANFSGEPGAMSCAVPLGTAIYVSVAGAGCSTIEPPPYFGEDEAELTECAVTMNEDWIEFSATINGEDVPDLGSYRVTTSMFTLSLPPGNFYEIDPITGYSVADAYSFIVAPPEPGTCEIEVTSLLDGEPEPWVQTHTVTVVEPEVIMPDASPDASPEATPMS